VYNRLLLLARLVPDTRPGRTGPMVPLLGTTSRVTLRYYLRPDSRPVDPTCAATLMAAAPAVRLKHLGQLLWRAVMSTIEEPITSGNEMTTLLAALTALKKGRSDMRLPLDWIGVMGKVADAFNEVV